MCEPWQPRCVWVNHKNTGVTLMVGCERNTSVHSWQHVRKLGAVPPLVKRHSCFLSIHSLLGNMPLTQKKKPEFRVFYAIENINHKSMASALRETSPDLPDMPGKNSPDDHVQYALKISRTHSTNRKLIHFHSSCSWNTVDLVQSLIMFPSFWGKKRGDKAAVGVPRRGRKCQ